MSGDEHHEFVVTIPAGTPIATPVVIPTQMPPRRIASIQWLVPPGPSGKAGWRISMGGVQVIPANRGAWIIRDGSADGAQLARLPDSGSWDVTGYNTGTFPHSLYITFHVDIIRPQVKLITPFGLNELQPGIDAPLAHRIRAG